MAEHLYLKHPKLYRAWSNMKTRCNNPNYYLFHRYGGRGIKVCERWNYFENFLVDMLNNYSEGLQLDRIDNNGDYTPDNCRWVTSKINNQNRVDTHKFFYKGKSLVLNDWANTLGIKRSTLSMRIHSYGWSIERAFTKGAKNV